MSGLFDKRGVAGFDFAGNPFNGEGKSRKDEYEIERLIIGFSYSVWL